jgi:hypothetical protein
MQHLRWIRVSNAHHSRDPSFQQSWNCLQVYRKQQVMYKIVRYRQCLLQGSLPQVRAVPQPTGRRTIPMVTHLYHCSTTTTFCTIYCTNSTVTDRSSACRDPTRLNPTMYNMVRAKRWFFESDKLTEHCQPTVVRSPLME